MVATADYQIARLTPKKCIAVILFLQLLHRSGAAGRTDISANHYRMMVQPCMNHSSAFINFQQPETCRVPDYLAHKAVEYKPVDLFADRPVTNLESDTRSDKASQDAVPPVATLDETILRSHPGSNIFSTPVPLFHSFLFPSKLPGSWEAVTQVYLGVPRVSSRFSFGKSIGIIATYTNSSRSRTAPRTYRIKLWTTKGSPIPVCSDSFVQTHLSSNNWLVDAGELITQQPLLDLHSTARSDGSAALVTGSMTAVTVFRLTLSDTEHVPRECIRVKSLDEFPLVDSVAAPISDDIHRSTYTLSASLRSESGSEIPGVAENMTLTTYHHPTGRIKTYNFLLQLPVELTKGFRGRLLSRSPVTFFIYGRTFIGLSISVTRSRVLFQCAIEGSFHESITAIVSKPQGYVYVGTSQGHIYAYRIRTAKQRWSAPGAPAQDMSHCDLLHQIPFTEPLESIAQLAVVPTLHTLLVAGEILISPQCCSESVRHYSCPAVKRSAVALVATGPTAGGRVRNPLAISLFEASESQARHDTLAHFVKDLRFVPDPTSDGARSKIVLLLSNGALFIFTYLPIPKEIQQLLTVSVPFAIIRSLFSRIIPLLLAPGLGGFFLLYRKFNAISEPPCYQGLFTRRNHHVPSSRHLERRFLRPAGEADYLTHDSSSGMCSPVADPLPKAGIGRATGRASLARMLAQQRAARREAREARMEGVPGWRPPRRFVVDRSLMVTTTLPHGEGISTHQQPPR